MNSSSRDICSEFARILGGTSSYQNNVCTATITRDISTTIMGRPSPTASSSIFAFNSLDQNGKALNLGEFSLLEKEVDPFIEALISKGITVSAVKKHWFYIKPQLVYANFQSIDNPLSFARKVRNAYKVLSYQI